MIVNIEYTNGKKFDIKADYVKCDKDMKCIILTEVLFTPESDIYTLKKHHILCSYVKELRYNNKRYNNYNIEIIETKRKTYRLKFKGTEVNIFSCHNCIYEAVPIKYEPCISCCDTKCFYVKKNMSNTLDKVKE